MAEALEQMTKLANELCDQLEKAEAENKSLREQLEQNKTASAAPVETPLVPEDVVQQTCDALVKAGSITAEQVPECKEAFTKDPCAAHRVLVKVLTAPAQEKTAHVNEDVSGGTLVNAVVTETAPQQKYAAVFQKLGLYL